MATKLKATIAYQPFITGVSRKFVRRKDVARNGGEAGPTEFEAQGWMGGAVLKSDRGGGLGPCERNIIVIRTTGRSTQPSSDELRAREMFQTVHAGVMSIRGDLSQWATRVLALWNGVLRQDGSRTPGARTDASLTVNGVSGYGYTVLGWVFAVQYAGLKANPEYNVANFPTSFDA